MNWIVINYAFLEQNFISWNDEKFSTRWNYSIIQKGLSRKENFTMAWVMCGTSLEIRSNNSTIEDALLDLLDLCTNLLITKTLI